MATSIFLHVFREGNTGEDQQANMGESEWEPYGLK